MLTSLNMQDVNVIDFYESWADGLAFCAILHSLLPEKIPFDELSHSYPHLNFSIANKAAKWGLYWSWTVATV